MRRVQFVSTADRFGLGWRSDLAAGLLRNLDRIDVLEVVVDDGAEVSRADASVFRDLAGHLPVSLHGTALGLASSEAVGTRRLDAMARLVHRVRPEAWTEHLAFVRGGGVEVGHLAAPPRDRRTLDGLARNVARARRVVGSAPLLENVASLLEPPGCTLDEAAWLGAVATETGAGLLLDLHNLHANAVNFRFDALAALRRMPLHRVRQVHLAGGRWITGPDGGRRLLDDHLHPVPDPVFVLLEELAARAPGPLDVILERDGRFPSVDELLAEVDRARAVVARGRARAAAPRPAPAEAVAP